MTATFKVIGDNVTVTFSYTGAKVQSVVSDCAEHLWVEEVDDEKVLNPFDKATNNQKLNIVDKHVQEVLWNMANSFKSTKAQALARELEKETEYAI